MTTCANRRTTWTARGFDSFDSTKKRGSRTLAGWEGVAPFWEGADRLTCRGDLVPRLPYWLPEEVTWPARSVPGRSAIGGGPWGLPGREPSARPAWCSFWPPEKLGTMRRPEEPSGPVLSGFVGPFGGAGMMTNDDLRAWWPRPSGPTVRPSAWP